MTWIRCSDRMPMGESCEVRLDLPHGEEWIETFQSANVETLRRKFGTHPSWIDRTEWRPVEERSHPHGLSRHYGHGVVGHGEGTWDLVEGDFS